jgi:16S rRNA (cytosine967-C5)-methyltransferase
MNRVKIRRKIWATEIAAQNQPARVILRVNTLKTTREALRAILMDLNIETETLKTSQMLWFKRKS